MGQLSWPNGHCRLDGTCFVFYCLLRHACVPAPGSTRKTKLSTLSLRAALCAGANAMAQSLARGERVTLSKVDAFAGAGPCRLRLQPARRRCQRLADQPWPHASWGSHSRLPAQVCADLPRSLHSAQRRRPALLYLQMAWPSSMWVLRRSGSAAT